MWHFLDYIYIYNNVNIQATISTQSCSVANKYCTIPFKVSQIKDYFHSSLKMAHQESNVFFRYADQLYKIVTVSVYIVYKISYRFTYFFVAAAVISSYRWLNGIAYKDE